MDGSGSWTISCPKCSHEWQTLRVGRRARTCPACGHVGARAEFAERETGTAAPAAPAKEEPVTKAKTDPPREDHKRLAGAARLAHEAKARGETVRVGKPFGSQSARSGGDDRAGSTGSSSSTGRRPSLRDRLMRII